MENQKPRGKQRRGEEETQRKVYGVFLKSILHQKVVLSITEIGNKLKQNLEKKLVFRNEGKCIAEGFIRPNSIQVIQYSSGLVNAENVEFHVVFECMLCHPVEGMLIECKVKTVTKAGIHAEVIMEEDGVIPITIFVARDHHATNKYFASIQENMKILTKVIGIRYELNDPYICVIATLEPPVTPTPSRGGGGGELPKLKIGENTEGGGRDYVDMDMLNNEDSDNE